MTAIDSPLDDVLLAVALLPHRRGRLTPAAVMSMLPLGTSLVDGRLALIEARLLRYIDDDGLTENGVERVRSCPARRALLELLGPGAPETALVESTFGLGVAA
jgi:hypothetical protein